MFCEADEHAEEPLAEPAVHSCCAVRDNDAAHPKVGKARKSFYSHVSALMLGGREAE